MECKVYKSLVSMDRIKMKPTTIKAKIIGSPRKFKKLNSNKSSIKHIDSPKITKTDDDRKRKRTKPKPVKSEGFDYRVYVDDKR